ncbi:MAG TPA: DUF362 domain-containing protein [Dehalococcoidia bacterium]|nr:DUF362 domain-containing protein [Dehalococcoidia bacterium]
MKNLVSLVRAGKSVEAAVRQAIDLAGGLKEIISADSRVLIKPNLCWPAPSGMGFTTDYRVTEAVAKIVLELGPKSVIIGEGSSAGWDFDSSHSTEEAFRVSGTAEVAKRLDVELRNLNRDAYEEVPVTDPYVMDTVRIARTALESDVIISVPVLKTHLRTLVTLSLKNMKGVMPGAEKRKTHQLGLDKAIADLNSVVRPSYVVVDALAGMQGLWEYPQDRFELGLIIAGADPVAVDTVGTYLAGFDPAQVMHLQYFAAREGKQADLSQVVVVGEPLEANRQRLRAGFDLFQSRYPEVSIIVGESVCTGCMGELLGALAAIKKFGDDQALINLTVILGSPNPDEIAARAKTVVLGKCAQNAAHLGKYVKGCPPLSDDMIRAICQVSGSDGELVITSRNEDRQRRWEETKSLLER